MTVASMPIVSPTGRGTPLRGHFDAAENIAAANHDAEFEIQVPRPRPSPLQCVSTVG